MNVFLDTEFTSLVRSDSQLISLALVTERGDQELYIELSDWERNRASEFVRDTVVPLLGMVESMDSAKVGRRITDWFASLSSIAVVTTDLPADLRFLISLTSWPIPNVSDRVCLIQHLGNKGINAQEGYFEENPGLEHHALHDARALRAGYLAAANPNVLDLNWAAGS